MKNLLLKPYLSAIALLLVAGVFSNKFYNLKDTTSIIIAATAMLVVLNASSILFYLSLNVDSKIAKFLFSIVNFLLFLFIGLFMVETFAHALA